MVFTADIVMIFEKNFSANFLYTNTQKKDWIFMNLYQNLETVRKQKKKTQREIANVLGTTQQQYYKYEKGHQELPIRHLITLSKYYNLSTDEILGIKPLKLIFSEDEENIVKMYSVLNDMGKGRVYQLLTMLTEEQLEEYSDE